MVGQGHVFQFHDNGAQYENEQERKVRYRKAIKWINDKGFEVDRVGIPERGEYFVNYKIEEDCSYYWFVPDVYYVKKSERKILKAEYAQVFGTLEMIPMNFDGKYEYFVVKKTK